jgi:hypothetical protein
MERRSKLELGKSSEITPSDIDGSNELDRLGINPDKLIDAGNPVSAPETNSDVFDPDKLIDPKGEADAASIEEQDVDSKDGSDKKSVSEIDESELYSSKADRFALALRSNGEWSDAPGDSKFKPNNKDAIEKLAEYGKDSVEYKGGVPNFSPFASESIQIEEMTPDIVTNRSNAYKALANKWNTEMKNGRCDWSQRDVADWKSENNLEFHECSDLKTCLFVPAEIHSECKHVGGRYEAKCRNELNNGGGFDE